MTQPHIAQSGQYLKDLSFENFMASAQASGPPGVDIQVDVTAQPQRAPEIKDGNLSCEYEVLLTLRVTARAMGKDGAPPKDSDPILFLTEAAYAGRYQLSHIPQKDVDPFLLVEAPRLLFPFARQIIADAILQGGLPPLLLMPVDFAQLYHQRMAQQQKN